MSLNRLAKLKQFSKGKSVEDYLHGELRQNLLAIENGLKSGFSQEYFFGLVGAISVANNSSGTLLIGSKFKIDPFSILTTNAFNVKDDGTYLITVSFYNLLVNGIKTISLNLMNNGILAERFTICEQTATSSLMFCPEVSFPVEFKKNDKFFLQLNNQSASNSNIVTIDSGLVRIYKLTIAA